MKYMAKSNDNLNMKIGYVPPHHQDSNPLPEPLQPPRPPVGQLQPGDYNHFNLKYYHYHLIFLKSWTNLPLTEERPGSLGALKQNLSKLEISLKFQIIYMYIGYVGSNPSAV